jgi:subtilisin family serine protease
VFVTILDGGVDSVHRWSIVGDGPENLFLDCYWIDGSGSSCYDDRQPVAQRGHGAHVAGIIAARDNNYGYIGIANNPGRLAAIKVCNSAGQCLPDWVADGLDWVLGETHPRRLVNMSLGWCQSYTILAQMTAQLASAGVLMVASAGNRVTGATIGFACPNGQHNDLGSEWATGVVYPARYSWVMAISGSLEDDAFADAPAQPGGGEPGGCGEGDMCGVPSWCPAGSRYGSQVELAAPFWAWSMAGDGLYNMRCGTSMSAALATGVAALAWSLHASLTADQLRQLLKDRAVPRSPATQFGSGRVDAFNAAYNTPPPPPPPPPSLNVGLNGYDTVQPYASCRWFATASGGIEPYVYNWEVDGQPIGDGTGVLTYANSGASFTINVLATDGQGRTGSNTKSVTVSAGAGECLDQ